MGRHANPVPHLQEIEPLRKSYLSTLFSCQYSAISGHFRGEKQLETPHQSVVVLPSATYDPELLSYKTLWFLRPSLASFKHYVKEMTRGEATNGGLLGRSFTTFHKELPIMKTF